MTFDCDSPNYAGKCPNRLTSLGPVDVSKTSQHSGPVILPGVVTFDQSILTSVYVCSIYLNIRISDIIFRDLRPKSLAAIFKSSTTPQVHRRNHRRDLTASFADGLRSCRWQLTLHSCCKSLPPVYISPAVSPPKTVKTQR